MRESIRTVEEYKMMSGEKEKFDPIKEIGSLRESLSRVVEQGMKTISGAFPAVDAYETASAIVIRTAPILGLDPNSIEISVENGVLTLRGSAAPDPDIPVDAKMIIHERRSGEFKREIKLPYAVKAEAAQAKLKQNMLTITLPRLQDSEPKIIGVTPAE